MMRWSLRVTLFACMGVLLLQPPLKSQGTVLGTFRWQVHPYCNVLTVTVVQLGPNYRVEGTDDQCGAPQLAAVTGLAFLNPDGSIGLGLTIIMTPGATPWHIDATIDGSGNGTWRDNDGQTGKFTLTPGNGTGGIPRPPKPPMNVVVDDPQEDVGLQPSVTIGQDGRPLISHHNKTAGTLRFTRCLDRDCQKAVSRDIDAPPGHNVGSYSSIAIGTDGLPIISHHDGTLFGLRVTHCNDLECTSVTATTVDVGPNPAATVGLGTSLAIGSDGLPVVGHLDQGADGLRISHCNDVACTSAVSRTVDVKTPPRLFVGTWPSIAIGSDGFPVVAHGSLETTIKSPLNFLRVTHCQDASCTASTSVNAGIGGRRSSVTIGRNQLPFIGHDAHYVFFSGSFGDGVTMTRCADSACSSSSATVYGAPSADATASVSAAVGDDGYPVVAYASSTRALRVIHCLDAACSTSTTATVDAAPSPVDVGVSMAVPSVAPRYPVIAYRDSVSQALRVVTCRSATCQ